jgi:small neutral amino acid transporter SnatA (MarC family)
MLSTAKKFLAYVLPGIIRPLHILWNQAIGFVFIVLAAVFGFRVVRGNESTGLRIVGGVFVLLIGWYGVSSFWRARKISKQ